VAEGDRRLRLGEALPATAAGVARAWRGGWGAIALSAAIWSLRPWVPEAARPVWLAAAVVAAVILCGALARLTVAGDEEAARGLGLGPLGLQLKGLELRLVGALALCGVFMTMILAVAALALLAVFGMADLNAEAIRLGRWAEVGPAWKLALLALLTLAILYAVVVLAVRLSLFAPATAGRGYMVSLNSMGIAQGSFRPLLAGLLLSAAPGLGLLLLWNAGRLSGAGGWAVAAVVLNAVQAPATLAFLGAAYRRLEYWTPEGGAHG